MPKTDTLVMFLPPDVEYGSLWMPGQEVEFQISLSGGWELSKPYRWFSDWAYITDAFRHSFSSLLNSLFFFLTVWSVRNLYTTCVCSCIRYDLILCPKSVKGAGGVSLL